jgi:hypothetical protein
MASATKRLAELLVAPPDSASEADSENGSDCQDPELIVLGLEDVELVEGLARRAARSEHRFRTSRIAPRRDRARRSSAPPRPANDLAAPVSVLRPTEPDLPGTARIALTMMALLFIAGIVIVLNPAL